MSRPNIPEPVKRAVIYLNVCKNRGWLKCAETGNDLYLGDLLFGRVHFDHNPPLALRKRDPRPRYALSDDFDKDPSTYDPHANDVRFIDVVGVEGHKIRTNKKRGLYHGDQTQIAKVKRIAAGGRKRRGPKIQSRGFQTNRDGKFKQKIGGKTERRLK